MMRKIIYPLTYIVCAILAFFAGKNLPFMFYDYYWLYSYRIWGNNLYLIIVQTVIFMIIRIVAGLALGRLLIRQKGISNIKFASHLGYVVNWVQLLLLIIVLVTILLTTLLDFITVLEVIAEVQAQKALSLDILWYHSAMLTI